MSVNNNPTASQQNMKNFLSQFFFHFSPVSLKPVINHYFRKSPRNFVKIRNVPHGILYSTQTGPRGKLVHEKNLKSKISRQTFFNGVMSTKYGEC